MSDRAAPFSRRFVQRRFRGPRASAYRGDKQLADFAASVADRLAAQGTGPDS